MKFVNTLDFEMFDPVKAGEMWAVDYGSNHKVVEIIIDGKKLIDIINEIEKPYLKAEGIDAGYGHNSPKWLYSDLTAALDDKRYFDYDYDDIYLFVCDECGEPGCWTVHCRLKEEDGFVYWYDFHHSHRDWEYDLTFRFEKSAYEKAMRKLDSMAKSQWM